MIQTSSSKRIYIYYFLTCHLKTAQGVEFSVSLQYGLKRRLTSADSP